MWLVEDTCRILNGFDLLLFGVNPPMGWLRLARQCHEQPHPIRLGSLQDFMHRYHGAGAKKTPGREITTSVHLHCL